MSSVERSAPAEQLVEMEFTVEPNYAGWRLDRYLCEKIRRLSRTRVQRIIERDLVCDRKLKPSSLVTAGLTFKLRRRLLEEPTDVPTAAELREVHRDDWLLILDKPAGLPIHPTARYHHGTLVSQLKALHGEGFRADPAHRLDRETSGLVVCGRTLQASQDLMRQFKAGEVHKQYLALCEGHPPRDEFSVDAAISEGTELIRIAVRLDQAGKPAQTDFQVLERFTRGGEPFSLVRCLPRTGRQHQIRVHLQRAGHSIVGDKMYGPDPGYFDRFSKHTLEPEAWARLRLPRHALHAAHIEFTHPGTRQSVQFSAPLPEDLEAFRAAAPLELA